MSTRIPISQCLACGAPNDAATPAYGRAKPKPGNLSICIRCGHMMAFDNNLGLRNLTFEEAQQVATDESVLRIQRARQLANRKRVQ